MQTRDNLLLAPVPQRVEVRGGRLSLGPNRTIILGAQPAGQGIAGARMLQAALDRHAGVRWEIRGASGLASQEGVVAVIDPKASPKRESYHLTVGEERIAIVGHDAAGVFYGFATLTQLVRQFGKRLPQLHIEDWPDFAHRGVMLDVSRDKVPTMESAYALVDMLAGLKVNEFQLYMEHTFAYEAHRNVWKDASPFTGEEILALDAYCRERHIELVPNQNSFGHMARWLGKKPYNELAESPRGARMPWGRLPPFTLDPANPGSLALIDGLYAELLPHFGSARFNVGCDETFDLGLGKSRDAVAAHGVGRVYLDFLLKIHALCGKYGRRMMFWGDIITRHRHLSAELPSDVTVLEWGYEHDHPFDVEGRAYQDAGLEFYVCPGTGGWNSFVGRTDNAMANIRSAALNGLKHGAKGVLNTEWGDNGHMQAMPVPWAGYLYGAAMSWSPKASADMDIAPALSLHAFHDASGDTGRIAFDMGNAYQVNGAKSRNGTLLQQLYLLPIENDWPMRRVSPGGFEATQARLAEWSAALDPARICRTDAGLVVEEMRNGAALAAAGAMIGAAKYARENGAPAAKVRAGFRAAAKRIDTLIPEYERLWLARNRPGGLPDSVAVLRSTVVALREAAS
ncbi:MAG TPA: glycoside hydrolase family 20 zincin-like fold domain-containing protein [Dehalococcoidia bacterium]|nr:glycoside hydrolase family 20 zincin-like fold domain-containing protein [Dehalococcoidia bacterium]